MEKSGVIQLQQQKNLKVQKPCHPATVPAAATAGKTSFISGNGGNHNIISMQVTCCNTSPSAENPADLRVPFLPNLNCSRSMVVSDMVPSALATETPYKIHQASNSLKHGMINECSNAESKQQKGKVTDSAGRNDNDASAQQIAPETPDKKMEENLNVDSVTQTSVSSHKVVVEEDKQQGEKQKRVNHIKEPKPKRKKHRPKVVRDVSLTEKNPVTPDKVTPKRAKRQENDKTSVRKRKNMSSLHNTSETIREAVDEPGEVRNFSDEHIGNRSKIIKRRLDKDFVGSLVDKHIDLGSSVAESSAKGMSNDIPASCGTKTTVHLVQGLEVEIENSAAGIAFDLNRTLSRVLNEYISLPECSTSSFQPSRREMLKRNWKKLARSAERRESVNNSSFVESANIENSYFHETHTSCSINKFTNPHRFQGPDAIFELDPAKTAKKKRSKIMILHRKRTSVVTVTISNQPQSCMTALLADNSLKVKTKKRTRKHQRYVKLTGSLNNILEDDLHNLHKVPVQDFRATSSFLDDPCTNLMSQAIIPYVSKRDDASYQGQLDITTNIHNILIPYGNRTIVPFVNHAAEIKKKRPRARVDLDEETNSMWKLLMDKESCDAEASCNIDREKWWGKERKIFQDRVDKFLSCMHYIQGDRSFSPWKGSVLDSVIGVFLTQNVSDILSSTAFMALAAKFPTKPRSSNPKPRREDMDTPAEQQDGSILLQVDASQQEKILGVTNYGQGSFLVHDAEDVDKAVETTNSIVIDSTQESVNVPDLDVNQRKYRVSPEASNNILDFSEAAMNDIGFEDRWPQEDGISSQNSNSSSASSPNYLTQTTNDAGLKLQTDCKTDMICEATERNTWLFEGQLSFSGATRIQEVDNNNNGEPLENYGAINHKSCQEAGKGASGGDKLETQEFCQETNSTSTSKLNNRGNNKIDEPVVYSMSCFDDMINLDPGIMETNICHMMQGNSYQSCERSIKFSDEYKPILQQDKEVLLAETIQTAEVIVEKQQSVTHEACSDSNTKNEVSYPQIIQTEKRKTTPRSKKVKPTPGKEIDFDWDCLRKEAIANGYKPDRTDERMDAIDWEAVRCADVKKIAETIHDRGMNNILAERIKNFLNRSVRDHGSLDLEWLRCTPPDKSREYLLSVQGLGLKSVECVRLLSLHQHAFPVDTNVGRICVRLGWVPIQPLPESTQFYLLELYPVMEHIQKYIWPRLCKLDQETLYQLHYQMITFGKVFCTKRKPNCNACPMKADCKHFASAYASARLALPASQENSLVNTGTYGTESGHVHSVPLPQLQWRNFPRVTNNCEPIIEEPSTPELENTEEFDTDIEDFFNEDPDEISHIQLNVDNFKRNLQNYMEEHMDLQDGEIQKALVAITAEAASIPMPKLKYVHRLRTEHQAYVLPDSHPLLEGLDQREQDDPCPYLLVIWAPGETTESTETPETCCTSIDKCEQCHRNTSFACNSVQEEQTQTIRGTLLIPCRTAMRGRFPLNGTYFQVNEVFADHHSSYHPLDVPRKWLWNLPRCTIYMGTNTSGIFAGQLIENIRACFWRGFICVRGFDRGSRAPRPLARRLHLGPSKASKQKYTPAKGEKQSMDNSPNNI